MNHLKWQDHSETLIQINKSLYQDLSSCDVFISCKNKTFSAHKFILCSCSDYFREIFQDILPSQETTIITPDLKETTVEAILSFIYTGEVCVNYSNLSDFLETINLLGIKSAISFECHVNKIAGIDKDNAQYELLEVDNSVVSKTEESVPVEEPEKEFEEYLDVYNEDEKIDQYSIEHIEPECGESNSEYILADNVENEFNLPPVKSECSSSIKTSEELVFSVSTEIKDDVGGIVLGITKENFAQTKSEPSSKEQKPNRLSNANKQSRLEAFQGAIQAVVEYGMSLQKAATKFNISKTVLWRRVKKNSAYKIEREHPMIGAALEKLENGESLKSISLALKIPISTLHRHKVRLLQEGRLPEHIQVKRRDSKDSLKLRLGKAIEACKQGMSQNCAATVFGVPKSTLWRHLQKEGSKGIKGEMCG